MTMTDILKLNDLKPKEGSRHRKKIIGRGEGSGHGGMATKGMKGQRSRAGFGGMVGFEGGQIPLFRRIPKRGFSRAGLQESLSVVNVSTLEKVFGANESVTPETLAAKGLASQKGKIKILGDGELKKPLQVKAHYFSKSAAQKIKTAGGTAEPC